MVVFALLGFMAKSSGMTVAKIAQQSGMLALIQFINVFRIFKIEFYLK
jgi:hypothetical protein